METLNKSLFKTTQYPTRISDDELRDELMDAYELIEDILNGVAY